MCGLTGFWQLKDRRDDADQVLRAMTTALAHRGPDADGTWHDAAAGLSLGHRRLAILDLSNEGAQPMHSPSGRYTLIYNGEIYNFRELRALLETEGASFRGHSDTEVFLAAIEIWGLNTAVQKIRGMFAMALWDANAQTLHLIRDRLGKKPLYLGWTATGTLLFASELKAFHAHPDFTSQVSTAGRSLYMRFGYVPAPYSIFERVWTVPAGHRAALSAQNAAPGSDLSQLFEPYWHHTQILEDSRQRPFRGSPQDMLRQFEELLSDSVRERMISDVPLGAFLSGGVDSTAIVALMQKHADQPVKTYTIGFHEDGYDEAQHAAALAQHLGTDHHEFYVSGEDVLAEVPHLPDLYDEPFADVSAIPTALVSRRARETVTVVLTGDGGDEMLGGYQRYLSAPPLWEKVRYLPRPARRAMAALIRRRSIERWSETRPDHPQFGERMYKVADILALSGPEEIYHRLLSETGTPQHFLQEYLTPQLLLDRSDYRANGLSFVEQMMLGDTLHTLPNRFLVKTDRASMASGLEARSPLLDARIYAFCWSLPQSSKVFGKVGKMLLRQLLDQHVPQELTNRPKQGFSMPIAAWLRGPLKEWADELLRDEMLQQNGFQPEPIRALWTQHQDGAGAHAPLLWQICQYQAWAGRWL